MTSVATPIYFGPSDRPLFGWLHPATNDATSIGVVICNPFGYEAICAHRTLRHAAENFAAAGFAALRFDYDGTGDSSGRDADPDRVAAWLSSIDAAINVLTAQAGVGKVCLFGLRLGATLAAIAAQRRGDAAALIAVAPVVEGRRLVRELRALALSRAPAAKASDDPEVGSREAAGFAIAPATLESLTQINLLQLSGPPAPQLLVLDRDDLPASDGWPTLLRAQGATVVSKTFQGYVEMLLDAHENVVPESMLNSSIEWLRNLGVAETAETQPEVAGAAEPVHVQMTLPMLQTGLKRNIQERAVMFGDRRLFGIVSRPAQQSTRPDRNRRQLLLLPNSGAVHHIGPGRLYVEVARKLASRGMTVVRLDIGGLGDSPARDGEAENQTYPPNALEDIHAVLTALLKEHEPTDFHMAGICSGAYQSLKAATCEPALRSVLIINPLTFYWKPGMSLAAPEYRITAEARRYQSSALKLTSWFKLLRGKVDIWAAGNVVRRRLQMLLLHGLRQAGRDLRLPVSDDLAAELSNIAARNTKMLFIFSESDPGLSMLLEQGGKAVGNLSRRGAMNIEIIGGADHTFTVHASREQLVSMLTSHFAGYLKRQSA